ncbi:hypothetical protein CK203_101194 [Vitis vinifera]|uniref:Uncharacterized protein n=1 Tax=Vitis vinifera TaxID=29760 RepID=A0A438F1U2_VITVI|nr:hypothetical protein CK203_101194 [Vitis vinifera]
MVIATLRALSETVVGDAAVRDRGSPDRRSASCISLGKSGWMTIRLIMRAMCHCFGSILLRPKNVFKEESCFICPGLATLMRNLQTIWSVKEFEDRLCIPNSVIVDFVNGKDAMSTEKAEKNVIIFTKETNSMRGSGSLYRLVQGIPPFHPDSTRLHSSQHRPGKQKLTSSACPLTYPPFNCDGAAKLDEGRAKGYVSVRGAWAGLSGRPGRPFAPNYSLEIPDRRQGEALQDAAFCAEFNGGRPESQEYVVNILPRKMSKEVVPGEHYTVKDLPIYQEFKEKRDADSPPKKNPAKKRKLVKNGKGVKEPTPPKEFVPPPPITHEAERLSVWRIWLRKLRPSTIRTSPNTDADELRPFVRPPWREAEAEIQSQPSDDPDRLALVLGEGATFKERWQLRFQPSPVMVPDEVAPGETHPAVNVEALHLERKSPSAASSGGELVNDAACSSASSFSYAELEDKLKQIPPRLGLTSCPQPRCSRWWKRLNCCCAFRFFCVLWLKPAYPSLERNNEALRADLAEAKSREESSSPVCVRQRMRWPG